MNEIIQSTNWQLIVAANFMWNGFKYFEAMLLKIPATIFNNIGP